MDFKLALQLSLNLILALTLYLKIALVLKLTQTLVLDFKLALKLILKLILALRLSLKFIGLQVLILLLNTQINSRLFALNFTQIQALLLNSFKIWLLFLSTKRNSNFSNLKFTQKLLILSFFMHFFFTKQSFTNKPNCHFFIHSHEKFTAKIHAKNSKDTQ